MIGRATGAVLVFLALAVVAATGSQAAEGPDRAGWWWKPQNQTTRAAVALEHPEAERGDLVVAGTPDGATAIAALRYELDDGDAAPVLELTAKGDRGGQQAIVAACLTGSPWRSTSGPGAWEEAPLAACDEGSVAGVRSDDGSAWTFALGPLLSNGLLDVVLVPGTVAELPDGVNGSSFELVFEAPEPGALQTTSGVRAKGSFVPPPVTVPSPEGAGSAGAGDATTGAISAGSTASLNVGSPPTPPVGAFEPSLPDDKQGYSAIAPTRERATQPAAISDDVRDPRLLGLVLLLATVGAGLLVGRTPVPALRRLGRFAGPEAEVVADVGGLGRFARPRVGSPPPLL